MAFSKVDKIVLNYGQIDIPTTTKNVLPRLLVSSALVSSAVSVYQFLMPLFLYNLTQSASAMANLRALEYLPNVFFAPIIGVIIDRLNKKVAHQGAVVAQIILLSALVLLAISGFPGGGIAIIYPIAFCLMTFGYINDNVRMVIVKQHIPQNELTQANSRLVSIWTIVGISIPAVAGMLLGVLQHVHILMLVVLLLCIAFAVIRGLPSDPPEIVKPKLGIVKSFTEGFNILKGNKTLLQVCLFALVVNVAQGIVDANLAFILKDQFSSTELAIGIVSSSAGVGAFLGSLVTPKARARLGIAGLFKLSFVMSALLCVPSILVPHPVTFALTLFGTAFFGMMQSICIWTFRQESTGAAYIGRVSGLTSALFKLGLPIGIFISGHFVSRFGSSMIFAAAASLHLLLFILLPFTKVAKVS
jgi:MFS family permease